MFKTLKRICVNTPSFKCDLELRERITILTGDSGVGKTYLNDCIIELRNGLASFNLDKSVSDINNIYFISRAVELEHLDFSSLGNEVIFIDNYSTIYTKEVQAKIDSSSNFFILVSHRGDRTYGNSPLGVTNLAKKDDTFKLEYIFNDGLHGVFSNSYAF